MRGRVTSFLVILMVAASGRAAFAQAAATVSLGDPAYAAIDELAAAFPVQGLFVGQRPYSRREIARIALRFDSVLSRGPTPPAETKSRLLSIVRSLLNAYANEARSLATRTSGSPFSASPGARLDVIGTNGTPRPVPRSNGLGRIEAVTNPLTDDLSGRPVAHGYTSAAELAIPFGIGSWLAIEADPRVTWLSDRNGSRRLDAEMQRLFARVVVWNVSIEAGADERTWGTGGTSGMLLSANPRPLHALTIANDTPFTFPGFLRRIGPVRATLLGATLGDSQNFPGAQLLGYKVDLMPTSRLELGVGLIDQLGGAGAPRIAVGERIKDLFPFVFLAISPGSDRQASNRIAGVDARYYVGTSRGITVYYEVDPDDFDVRRLRSVYWQDSGHLLGTHVDRLTSDGRLSLDAQFQRTSLRLYEHDQFSSGVTYRGAIIGDPLGPNAYAGYATLSSRLASGWKLSLSGALEWRDSSVYTVVQSDTVTGRGWRFVKVADGVKENRARAVVSLINDAADRLATVSPILGVERVLNENFVRGRGATNVIASVSLRLRF
jgi:Capsule assembly protein Wzi